MKGSSACITSALTDWPIGKVVLHGSETSAAGVTWTSPGNYTIRVEGGVWLAQTTNGRTMQWTLKRDGVALTGGVVSATVPYSSAAPFLFENGSGGPSASTFTVSPGTVVTLEITKVSAAAEFVGLSMRIARVTCFGDFADLFDDGCLAPEWVQVGSCGPAVETNGQLVLSKPDGCGTVANRGTVGVQSTPGGPVLCGDFDVQVDFDLASFGAPTPGNALYTGLLLRPASGAVGIGHVAAIERFFENPTDGCTPFMSAYKFFDGDANNCAATWLATASLAGKFRMVRIGTTVHQYIWMAPSWVKGGSQTVPTDPLSIVLYSGSTFGDPTEVAFDNLIVRTTTVSVPVGPRVPASLLVRNVPNPFNEETAIEFSLPTEEAVTVRIYDVAGRNLRTVAKAQSMQAGLNRLLWDGKGDDGQRLPPGAYFYRVWAGGTAISRRALMLN
jgi:hypothetical protein